MTSMKALVVSQPFASFIALGLKTFETRTWRSSHRGPLVICAGRRDHEIMGLLPTITDLPGLPISGLLRQALAAAHRSAQATIGYPRGVALAIARMDGCRAMTSADEERALCPWDDGRLAWEFPTVVQIQHFKVKGKLSIFDLPIPQEFERALADRVAEFTGSARVESSTEKGVTV